MNRIPFYHVDAFTSECFGGNPAGVCLPDVWPEAARLQAIAAENCLSETAFIVAERKDCYRLRWFSPTMEIDLCGHATLATAHVLYRELGIDAEVITFRYNDGLLQVRRDGAWLALDFPARPARRLDRLDGLTEALGATPAEVWLARDVMAVFETEEQVKTLNPDPALILKLSEGFGVIATAPGRDCDFVSRFFVPKAGIAEDPVTGSSHCTLTPYWSKRLGRPQLDARQISRRGGRLRCNDCGDRVGIAGQCVLYSKGEIYG